MLFRHHDVSTSPTHSPYSAYFNINYTPGPITFSPISLLLPGLPALRAAAAANKHPCVVCLFTQQMSLPSTQMAAPRCWLLSVSVLAENQRGTRSRRATTARPNVRCLPRDPPTRTYAIKAGAAVGLPCE